MRADELVDLQPPPEVTALGRPDQVFRLTPTTRNLLAYGGQALGVAALALTVYVMVGASLQGVANFWWVPPALVFVALSCILLVWAGKVHRGPVYAFFPEALALCQDGHWSVLPWEDVRAFRDRSGLGYDLGFDRRARNRDIGFQRRRDARLDGFAGAAG